MRPAAIGVTERNDPFRSRSGLLPSPPPARFRSLTFADVTVQPGIHWTFADIDALEDDGE